MLYPKFFDEVEPILLYDPLADFLGAVEAGEMQISYLDVVKFAGHSCPTVAGAYLMSKVALERLFIDALPIRGEIAVYIRGKKSEGVNGVIGNTIAYICGVSDEAGFKGIGNRFNRSNKLFFDANIRGEVKLVRLDTNEAVELSYDPSIVPPDPKMKALMQKIVQQSATIQERKEFQKLWQQRVATILLQRELLPKLIKVF